jgi:predicted AlkP superfamily pyrophosphatase or phosphodiesterase
MLRRLAFGFWLLFLITPAAGKAKRPRLIIWSIDGLAAGYLKQPRFAENENWQYLLRRAKVYSDVETTVPAVTYPAHTSMVTGLHPASHGIQSNHPVDPFNLARGGWMWYAADIRARQLWDLAREQGKSVANLQWPVTMTQPSRIRWHIPQFERAKGPEEVKLMRVISTPGLHREIETEVGVSLTESSSDRDRINAALYVWEEKAPDLMLLYTPGLDATEHAAGPYSQPAYAVLDELGVMAQKLVRRVRRQGGENNAVLIVSDHGFMTYRGKCYPNSLLLQQGFINPEQKGWSFYFDTAGGVARLVRNTGVTQDFPAARFAALVSRQCPGIEYIDADHADYDYLHTHYSKQAEGFLVSRSNVVMSPSWGAQIFDEAATGHTHGFLPQREDMKTVAIAFTGNTRKTVAIRHVTDIYRFACHWLHLECPTKKNRRIPASVE